MRPHVTHVLGRQKFRSAGQGVILRGNGKQHTDPYSALACVAKPVEGTSLITRRYAGSSPATGTAG